MSHALASDFKALDARDIPVYMTLPVCSLRLSPVEECWRQLQEALDNWSIDSHSELPTAIDAALGHLSYQILRIVSN